MLDQRTHDLYAVDEEDEGEFCCTNGDPCPEHWQAMQDIDAGTYEPYDTLWHETVVADEREYA